MLKKLFSLKINLLKISILKNKVNYINNYSSISKLLIELFNFIKSQNIIRVFSKNFESISVKSITKW